MDVAGALAVAVAVGSSGVPGPQKPADAARRHARMGKEHTWAPSLNGFDCKAIVASGPQHSQHYCANGLQMELRHQPVAIKRQRPGEHKEIVCAVSARPLIQKVRVCYFCRRAYAETAGVQFLRKNPTQTSYVQCMQSLCVQFLQARLRRNCGCTVPHKPSNAIFVCAVYTKTRFLAQLATHP